MQQQDNHEYPFLYQRQTCHQVQPNQATYQKRQKCQPATYLQVPLSAADLPPSPTKSSNLSETAEVPACNVPSRSEERFSRNAETDLVCRLLLEKKKKNRHVNIVGVGEHGHAEGGRGYSPRCRRLWPSLHAAEAG